MPGEDAVAGELGEPTAARKAAWLMVLPWDLHHVGGVNQVVCSLAQQMLQDTSTCPIVMVFDWGSPAPRWEVYEGIPVLRWRVRPPPASLKDRLGFLLWRRKFESDFRALCSRRNVRMVNMHYPVPASQALLRVARRAVPDIPVVVGLHGLDLTSAASGVARERARWRSFFAACDGVVACSRSLAERFDEAFPGMAPVQVIHNGVDVGRFASCGPAQSAASPRRVISIGKYEQKKGQDVLLRAFARVLPGFSDVVLELAGASGDGQVLAELQALAQKLSIAERVTFRCDVPYTEIAALLDGASLFVLPSRQEPFGIAIVEAGAAGLPVVASRVGGVPEIIEHDVNGQLVPPEDEQALAEVMSGLLSRPEFAARLGERLRTDVTARFTWAAAWHKYQRLITGVPPTGAIGP